MNVTLFEPTRAARVLRAEMPGVSHNQALEIVTRRLGHRDRNTASAKFAGGIGTAVPMPRIVDVPSAHEFYLDYLGFTLEWKHRFKPGMPLYTRIRRDDLVIDLSEHHGDGTPGSGVWVPVTDVHALHRELSAKNYPRRRPLSQRHLLLPGDGPMTTLAVSTCATIHRDVATRAVQAPASWTFDTDATTLELRRQADNAASCRMAEKSGFPLRETLPATSPWPLPGHVRTA